MSMLFKRNRRRHAQSSFADYRQLESRQLLSADYSLVSVNTVGDQSNGNAGPIGSLVSLDVSANGRYVVFVSAASNLVPNDTNGVADVFIRDVVNETTMRVSETESGDNANALSLEAAISANGRFVVFSTAASNMLDGTSSNGADRNVYVRDLQLGTLSLVSKEFGTNNFADGSSIQPAISGDGKFVAFQSTALNLTQTPTTPEGIAQVFVASLETGEVTLASSTATGAQGSFVSAQPTLSYDGEYVAFVSQAYNLKPDYDPSSDPDFGAQNAFRKNISTGAIDYITDPFDVNDADINANVFGVKISDDGQFVSYTTRATNIVLAPFDSLDDVFLWDALQNTNEIVSKNADGTSADDHSFSGSLSADGSSVWFASSATNLIDGTTGNWIFRWDRSTGEVSTIEEGFDDQRFESGAWSPVISQDGNYLVFLSGASNITDGDSNGTVDVFRSLISPNTVVQNRSVFYDNSAYSSSGVSSAIAPDKSPLLPGGTATFENYTSASAGINGLAIDIDSPDVTDIGADDFEFKFGNVDDVATWTTTSPSVTVTVDIGGGNNRTDRVALSFPDGEIENGWLQIRMLANGNTGLAQDDVFYFGNAIGETGDNSANARVNLLDVSLARSNQSGFSAATIDNRYDFNRDSRVNLLDVSIARANQSGFVSLALITPFDSSFNSNGDSGSDESSSDNNRDLANFDASISNDSKTSGLLSITGKRTGTESEFATRTTPSLAGAKLIHRPSDPSIAFEVEITENDQIQILADVENKLIDSAFVQLVL